MQIRAYRLLDNRIAEDATWDLISLSAEIESIVSSDIFDLSTLGWDAVDARGLAEAPAKRVPTKAQLPSGDVEPRVAASGDLWLLGEHRLLCASSADPSAWALLMNNEKAGFAIFDPGTDARLTNCLTSDLQKRDLLNDPKGGRTSPRRMEFMKAALRNIADFTNDKGVTQIYAEWPDIFEAQRVAGDLMMMPVDLLVVEKKILTKEDEIELGFELVLMCRKKRRGSYGSENIPHSNLEYPRVWRSRLEEVGSIDNLIDINERTRSSILSESFEKLTIRNEIIAIISDSMESAIIAAERTGRVVYGISRRSDQIHSAISCWEDMTGKKAIHVSY